MKDISSIIIILFCMAFLINICSSQEQNATKLINSEDDTDITVTKSVQGAPISPITLKYKIVTPKVDDFDFVLALDSSGSFGVGGDPFSTQKKAVLEAVPEFIKEIRYVFSWISTTVTSGAYRVHIVPKLPRQS